MLAEIADWPDGRVVEELGKLSEAAVSAKGGVYAISDESSGIRMKALLLHLAEGSPTVLLDFLGGRQPEYLALLGVRDILGLAVSKLGLQSSIEWMARHDSDSRMLAGTMDRLIGDPRDQVKVAGMLNQLASGGALSSIDCVLDYIASKDVDLALKYLEGMPIGDVSKASSIAKIAINLRHSNPSLAYELLTRSRIPVAGSVYGSVLAAWLGEDANAAFAAAQKLDAKTLRDVFLSQSLVGRGFLSPDLAERSLSLFATLPITSDLRPAHEAIMLALARTSPSSAIAETQKLGPSPYRDSLLSSVFSAIVNSAGREMAFDEMQKLDQTERETAIRGIVRELCVRDVPTALQIASEQDGTAAANAYREIGKVTAYQRPADAVKMLENPTLSDKLGADFRQEMLNATVTTWAKQDLSAAQQWVENLPETDAAKGYQGLMTTWMKTDPVAASGWLSSQPLGPAREAGARVLISQIKDTDPEMAEQWRKTLPPPVK